MDFRTVRMLFMEAPPEPPKATVKDTANGPGDEPDAGELVPPPPGMDDIAETDPDLAFRPSGGTAGGMGDAGGLGGMPGEPGMPLPGTDPNAPAPSEPESQDADAITAQVDNKLTKMCDKAVEAFDKQVMKNDGLLKDFLEKVKSSGTKMALKNYLESMYIASLDDNDKRMFATVSVDKFSEIMAQKILGKLL